MAHNTSREDAQGIAVAITHFYLPAKNNHRCGTFEYRTHLLKCMKHKFASLRRLLVPSRQL